MPIIATHSDLLVDADVLLDAAWRATASDWGDDFEDSAERLLAELELLARLRGIEAPAASSAARPSA